MLGFITPIVHLILTKPLGGVIFPVADKATDGGLDREILQPGRSRGWRQRRDYGSCPQGVHSLMEEADSQQPTAVIWDRQGRKAPDPAQRDAQHRVEV